MSESEGIAALRASSLSKRYGRVTALADVDLAAVCGEVLAVVGDNGAGKSTLVAILSGVTQPDSGTVYVDGREVRIDSPRHAQELGITTVFQDLALIDQREVAANMFLGREPRRLGIVVDRPRMLREASAVIERLRVGLPSVRALAGELSGGQRQAVAIARAVMQGSRVLLMDEPTAALGVREAGRVVHLIKELRAEGHPVVLVSHNMESVFELADRVMVLRLGRKVVERAVGETTVEEIVRFIVDSSRHEQNDNGR